MRTDTSMKAIEFGTRKITYNLYQQNRKRMRIVVSPELTVDVFAPATDDEEQIRAAVMKKAAWIAGKLDAQTLGKLQPQGPYYAQPKPGKSTRPLHRVRHHA